MGSHGGSWEPVSGFVLQEVIHKFEVTFPEDEIVLQRHDNLLN